MMTPFPVANCGHEASGAAPPGYLGGPLESRIPPVAGVTIGGLCLSAASAEALISTAARATSASAARASLQVPCTVGVALVVSDENADSKCNASATRTFAHLKCTSAFFIISVGHSFQSIRHEVLT